MTRTDQQNKAFRKYWRMLAAALNEQGLTVEQVLSKPVDLPWTPGLVEDLIWRRIQTALYQKKSTTELQRSEVSQIYDVINNHLSSSFGVYVPFPSRDEQ